MLPLAGVSDASLALRCVLLAVFRSRSSASQTFFARRCCLLAVFRSLLAPRGVPLADGSAEPALRSSGFGVSTAPGQVWSSVSRRLTDRSLASAVPVFRRSARTPAQTAQWQKEEESGARPGIPSFVMRARSTGPVRFAFPGAPAFALRAR